MKIHQSILKQALKWRISSLQSQYNFRDDEFISQNEHLENRKDGIWTDYYYRMQIERDKVMAKIYKCEEMIREMESESTESVFSANDKVIGVLFIAFIALSFYGLNWFNEIMR